MRILHIFLILSTFLTTYAQGIAGQYNGTYYSSHSQLYKITIQDNEFIYSMNIGPNIIWDPDPIIFAKCKMTHLSDSFYKIDNSPYPFDIWWDGINTEQRHNDSICDSICVDFNFPKCSTPLDISISCTDHLTRSKEFNISITNSGSILLPSNTESIYFAFYIPDKYIMTPSGYFNGYLYYFYRFDVNKKCNQIDISTDVELDSLFYQTEIRDNIIIMENDSIIWDGVVFCKQE